jgi:hypothetical protein
VSDVADQPPDQSRFLGWSGGRALVATSQSECGSAEDPGVQAVEPATGTATELVPQAGTGGFTTEHVLPWRRQP